MNNAGKKLLEFIAKSALFTAIFWSAYFFLLRPTFLPLLPSSALSTIEEAQQSVTYAAQLSEANEQLRISAHQQRRMDAILSQQEKQIKRYDEILSNWEQQAKK